MIEVRTTANKVFKFWNKKSDAQLRKFDTQPFVKATWIPFRIGVYI